MIIPRRLVDREPGELHTLLGQAGNGPPHRVHSWEKTFSSYVGRQYGIAVGSGRLAMKLILSSLQLPAGSEVIIPAYTLKDLLAIITDLGLQPVPADIDPDCWNVTAATIQPRLSTRTKAILVLHLFGNPAPMPEIVELADTHGLKVIEDCAHSAGSRVAQRQTGSFGHAAFFSFEAIKPINTYGGGMIVTDDTALAEQARKIADSLPPPVLTKKIKAVRLEALLFASGLAFLPLALLATSAGQRLMTALYRLIQPAPTIPTGYSNLQAELGIKRLASLERRIKSRNRQASLLREGLPPSCRSQRCLPGAMANYYFFVIEVPGDVQRLRRRLLLNGIDAGIKAEIADDCASLLKDRLCPGAARLYLQALHLPLHEKMTDRQLHKIAGLLQRFCR